MKFRRHHPRLEKFRTASYAFASALTIASSGAFFVGGVSAAPTVTYTFDGGGYTSGEQSPLNNAAPDLNPANTSFTANFGGSAAGGTFELTPSFAANTSGLTLFEPAGTVALSISTSVPITSVSLAWVADATAATGTILLIDANGGSAIFNDPNGSTTTGAEGSLMYTSATPFTGFTLQAYGSGPTGSPGAGPDVVPSPYDASSPTQIDVDNIVFTLAVPEPSTWAMLSLGAVGTVVVAMRRRQTA